MPYRLIAAMGKNFGIGHRSTLPWNIPSDMQQFTKLTRGSGNNAVVMGRNTWESIACSPLRGRANIVMSSDPGRVLNAGATAGIARSMPALLEMCRNGNYDDVWIIGGGLVYEQFLTQVQCESCHLTHIDHEYPADVYFPMDLIRGKWITESILSLSNNPKVEQHVMIPGDTLQPSLLAQDRYPLRCNESYQKGQSHRECRASTV